MDLFKKRRTAVWIFAAVVIVFSLLGCHRSLSKACKSVEDGFFTAENNVAENYYTSPGEQLGYCVKYANRLLSVIGNSGAFSDAYAAVYSARLALDEALQARDISGAYAANESLLATVMEVQVLVNAGAQLPASNDDYVTIVSDFFNAEAVAARSGYNDAVDAFIANTINVFPTNLLRTLSGVKLPAKFA